MDTALLRARAAEDIAQREKAFAAEKNIAGIRLAVVLFNGASYFAVIDRSGHLLWLAYTILGLALTYSLIVVALQPYRRFPALIHAYFTSATDSILITVWLYATGGWESPYFVLWYASIVAVAFRYSYRWAMIMAAMYSGVYTGLVIVTGQLARHEGELLVRLAYIFFTGAVAGAVSTEAFQQSRSKLEMRDTAAELERMVASRTAQLEAANHELEAFSYSVSHDLRAPLRSIDGFSQVLVEDFGDKLPQEARGYLQRIRSASQRMAGLIDDMLQLSRLTRAEMRRGAVDLSALAGEILTELKERDPARRIEPIIEDGIVAEADPRLARILLSNLLDNAWKFSSKHPSARIEFGVTGQDGARAYYVRDDGAGFDASYADKLFGVFQRLHSASEFDGNGVGLATVQRIVSRHGGRVWAEGEVENGATFYFTLGERG
jgi:signal transduction histidine kinase